MSDHLDIEEFFKESLKEVEYPASSQVWNNISSSLATSASAASSAGSGSFLGLGKVGTIVTVASTVGLISAGAVYLTMDNKIKKLEEKATISSKLNEEKLQEIKKEKPETYNFSNNEESELKSESKTNNKKEKYIVIEDPKPSEKTQNKLITVDKEIHEDPAINEEDSTETYVILYDDSEEETSSENNTSTSVVSVIKPEEDTQPNVVELNVSKISGYAPLEVIFSSSGNGSKDYWDFGDGETSEELLPRHTFAESGEYTVRLTTEFANGETKTVTKVINVKRGSSITKIPNVFSPNGDGNNDEYYLEMEGITYFHGFILDFEGNTVFEFFDQDQHWTGKDKYGEDLPEGKYIFTYKAEGVDGNTFKDKVIVTLKK